MNNYNFKFHKRIDPPWISYWKRIGDNHFHFASIFHDLFIFFLMSNEYHFFVLGEKNSATVDGQVCYGCVQGYQQIKFFGVRLECKVEDVRCLFSLNLNDLNLNLNLSLAKSEWSTSSTRFISGSLFITYVTHVHMYERTYWHHQQI